MANHLPRGLIVSCQAYEGEPLFGPAIMAAMARAALEGGAVGIRANGPADVVAIRAATDCFIVGLHKLRSPSSPVYITPTCEAAAALVEAGCDMIAIDATARPRPNNVTLAELVAYIHGTLHTPIMADIASLEDAAAAEALGVDALSTTLAGYTEHGRPPLDGPDLELLAALVAQSRLPVVAEGRYQTPDQLRRAFELGAHAVVIGGAITRPQDITRRFVQALPAALRPTL
jgi:N-acylglucosamine-6-phosphate 2-epimerase